MACSEPVSIILFSQTLPRMGSKTNPKQHRPTKSALTAVCSLGVVAGSAALKLNYCRCKQCNRRAGESVRSSAGIHLQKKIASALSNLFNTNWAKMLLQMLDRFVSNNKIWYAKIMTILGND